MLRASLFDRQSIVARSADPPLKPFHLVPKRVGECGQDLASLIGSHDAQVGTLHL